LWVETTGFFTWLEYYHYRGNLFSSISSAYFRTGAENSVTIESFYDPKTSRSELQHSSIKVSGLFYTLCDKDLPDGIERKDVLFLFGPCHYTNAHGWMLKDVTIDAVASPPFQRLKGEANRPFFNDLHEVPLSNGDLAGVLDATREWVQFSQEQPEQFLRKLGAIADPASPDEFIGPVDTDNWAHFLVSPNSPIARLKDRKVGEEIRVFSGNRDEIGQADTVISCICTVNDCADRWPLLERDTWYFGDDYVCVHLDRSGEGEWTWGS
jgi:hypothetical protein